MLNDGTNQYLYGLGRIAQAAGTTTDYFLPDALGSVRQLTDASGQVTLANAYEPYGNLAQTAGSAQTSYGFTGEFTDPSGMVYLRARYYSPNDGRFLTRDTWMGEYNRPLSLNRWGYVEGNPVNNTDPTGNITEQEAKMADFFVDLLRKDYNVKIEKDWGYPLTAMPPSSLQPIVLSGILWRCGDWGKGNWRSIHEIKLVYDGVKAMSNKLGGGEKFRTALAGMPISFQRMSSDFHSDGVSVAWTILDIKIYNKTFDYGDVFARGTVVHELAHVWDTRRAPIFSLSSEMSKKTKSYRFICPSLWSIRCPYKFDPNGLEDPPTEYGKSGEREDFADSFAICVYSTYKGASSLNLFPIRKDYIEGLIDGNKCS